VGSPTGREPYGDGGLVVVVGVTSHQGDWESQSQGKGDQVSVAGDRGGMRNAERHILCHASRVSGIQALESRVQLQAACPVRRGLVGKGAHKCHLASQLLYRTHGSEAGRVPRGTDLCYFIAHSEGIL